MSTSGSTTDIPSARRLSEELTAFGSDQFAEWLLRSFGGPHAIYAGNRFVDTGNEAFFAHQIKGAWPEFTDEARAVVTSGLAKALMSFEADRASDIGRWEMNLLTQVSGLDR